ncbi:DUF2577 domain-containing protein [Viridibacillus arvi]|uniref:DUF2577 domain-containing protein n=1 Tax=Viridibacillus arvi TaxID=263475 RepID=UPI003D05A598
MPDDGLTEFAKMFKDRDNKTPSSITTGIVITPPPEITIKLNDVVVLSKENLIFSAHMLKEYYREADIEGELRFTQSNAGQTSVADAHSHGVETVNIDTNYEAKVKITMTDTIQKDDEVILMPTMDQQLYFVIDKAVRFE